MPTLEPIGDPTKLWDFIAGLIDGTFLTLLAWAVVSGLRKRHGNW